MVPNASPASRGLAGHGPDAIRVAEHAGVAVVTIRGGIDVGSAPVIRDVLGWAVGSHDRVVIDFTDVTYIDRDGLGLLITMQDRAHHRDVELCFTALSSGLMSALRELDAEALFTPIGSGNRTRRHSQSAAERELDFLLPRPGRLCWQAR